MLIMHETPANWGIPFEEQKTPVVLGFVAEFLSLFVTHNTLK